jgi:hypothetical protein
VSVQRQKKPEGNFGLFVWLLRIIRELMIYEELAISDLSFH